MSLTLLSTVCGFFSEPFRVHWTKLRMSAPNVRSGFLAANLPAQTENNNRRKLEDKTPYIATTRIRFELLYSYLMYYSDLENLQWSSLLKLTKTSKRLC